MKVPWGNRQSLEREQQEQALYSADLDIHCELLSLASKSSIDIDGCDGVAHCCTYWRTRHKHTDTYTAMLQ